MLSIAFYYHFIISAGRLDLKQKVAGFEGYLSKQETLAESYDWCFALLA